MHLHNTIVALEVLCNIYVNGAIYNVQSILLNLPPVNSPPRLWLGFNNYVTR